MHESDDDESDDDESDDDDIYCNCMQLLNVMFC